MKLKVPFKSPIWILFILCLIFEVVGLILMLMSKSSICIAAFEVSKGAMVFMLFIITPLFPDLTYVIAMIFMQDLGKEPLGVIYNFIIGIGCLAGGIFLCIMLTFCGNSAQIMILVAGVFGLLAGIAHLINGGICHWLLPKGEGYKKQQKKA